MFFSPELLARRDSGMGLLWLAATLGSRSALKKLHKRSVLSADIAQLCDQISEPPEPLALRLSSNLMVGVVRVYKVKQEIFLSDVTNCFNSLKKMIQDIRSKSASDADLQMAQTSARPSALTLTADPKVALAMEFDALVADWDEYLNIGKKPAPTAGDDEADEFVPEPKQKKHKNNPNSLPEHLRAELCTLKESHDLLLSTSFEASFNDSGVAGPLSSQFDGGFDFDDNIFGAADVFDISGGLGDELAKELGEGWGSPLRIETELMDVDPPLQFDIGGADAAMDVDFDLGGNADMGMGMPSDPPAIQSPRRSPSISKDQRVSGSDKENRPPSALRSSVDLLHSDLGLEDFVRSPLAALEYENQRSENMAIDKRITKSVPNKIKKTRLLLDPRTELTDEELKAARAQYLQEQNILRREIELKKYGKESNKIIDDIVWGVPNGIQAQVLVDFWLENFKVQVESRTGIVHIDTSDKPPPKRRKVIEPPSPPPIATETEHANIPDSFSPNNYMDMPMDGGDMGFGLADDFYYDGGIEQELGRLPSSEDPEQARRVSRPPSAPGSHLGLEAIAQDILDPSQRSSLFPWDHAGASSSVVGAAFETRGEGSDRASIDQAEVRLRSMDSPHSRRGSSLASQIGSAAGKVGFSPLTVGNEVQLMDDDFAFEVPVDHSIALEAPPDINLGSLEKNSFNFLEYAKMQHQTLPASSALKFDDIVPKSTSTPHVAAAALYHCLVLATKDLIHLQQKDAYGVIAITFV